MTRLTVGGLVVGAFAIGVTAGMLAPGYLFGVDQRPMYAQMSSAQMPAHVGGPGVMPMPGMGPMSMAGAGSMMGAGWMWSMHDTHHGWTRDAR